MLNEKDRDRNKNMLLDKQQLMELLVQEKLRVHVTTLCYQAKVIIIEDNSMKYTLRHFHPDCTDNYLIPVACRGDFYLRKWVNDVIIIRKRKNLLFLNQLSTLVNLLWSML